MTIKVYNSLGRSKQEFVPLIPGKVSMYVCGPTVYDSCHIGHARCVVVFDVIYRYLRAKGYDVYYVRNFTDVDDKIINRANKLGISCQDLATRYIDEFHADMKVLNMEPPEKEPLATDHIGQIIRIVSLLMEKGYAYESGGDVFFAVEKWPEYGKLSGRRLEDMEAGARIDVDPRKQSPFDFVLWKASKPGEPSWDSPWGKGRPGWHIECSAMSAQYLGETFDIHGGGKDLIFPHHENEIAQSEAAFGKPFARYWIHNGFININQKKMSKSLGNFLMIKDIIKTWHPEALRLFIVSSHYRSPLDYTPQAMAEASASLDKIYGLLERISRVYDKWPPEIALEDDTKKSHPQSILWQRFCEAMDDDFNTARAMGILFEAVRNLNRRIDQQGAQNACLSPEGRAGIGDMIKIGNVLGLMAETPENYFQARKQAVIESQEIDPQWVEEKIRQRADARKAKDFALADQIRDQLQALNIILEDRPEGTIWKHGDGKT